MRRDGVRIGRGGRVAVGTAATLALGLSACGGDDDGKISLGQGSSSASASSTSMPSESISSAPMSSAPMSSAPMSPGSSMPGGPIQTGGATGGAEAVKPPEQIFADARQAVASARSVHVVGLINNGSIDLVMTSANTSKGTVPTDSGQSVPIVVIGPDEVYGAQSSGGQLVRLPVADAREIGGVYVKNSFFDQIFGQSTGIQRIGEATVDGQAAVVLRSAKGGVLAVADNVDHPYPLRLQPKSQGSSANGVSFGDWDQDVTITAPSTG